MRFQALGSFAVFELPEQRRPPLRSVLSFGVICMSAIKRAIRLAVIVQAVSCLAMLYQSNPVSVWNSWCDSLGWPRRAVEDTLLSFFLIVHPIALLFGWVFGGLGFEVHNGRLVVSSPLGVLVLLLQCALWSVIFLGLLRLEQRVRLLFQHRDAELGAPPNGGPATPVSNSGAAEGPLSVS